MPLSKQFKVSVRVSYLAEHSDIEKNSYVFAYHVTISNIGELSAKLISRHWVIKEADGEIREVQGLGVIGEQPVIKPNTEYQYSSRAILKMPTGTMHGSYQMQAEDGTQFEASISSFTLIMPRVLH